MQARRTAYGMQARPTPTDAAGGHTMRPSRSGTERGAAASKRASGSSSGSGWAAGSVAADRSAARNGCLRFFRLALSSMNMADTCAVALLERDRSSEGATHAWVIEACGPVGLITSPCMVCRRTLCSQLLQIQGVTP